MRLVTFNVNGLRARIKSGWPTPQFLQEFNPDIICLQEVRAKDEQLPAGFLPGYVRYRSIHEKAGYAGAWTFVREGFEQPSLHLDDVPGGFEKGRVSILDFKYFKLINSYSPNAGSRLEKLGHRREFEDALFEYIQDAIDYKPIIVCGDLNVAPTAMDTNIKCQAGTSTIERHAYDKLTDLGLFDAWRAEHPTTKAYSFFSNMYAAREENKGMRLDHFLVDRRFGEGVAECRYINDQSAVCGSDHTPLFIEISM